MMSPVTSILLKVHPAIATKIIVTTMITLVKKTTNTRIMSRIELVRGTMINIQPPRLSIILNLRLRSTLIPNLNS